MQRSSKGTNNSENVRTLVEGSSSQWRVGVINFRNIFQGVSRRVQAVSFSRLLANSAKHSGKAHRLRVLSFLTLRLLKEKKQSAFNRIKSKRIQHIVSEKGSSNLALTVRRIYKNLLKNVMRRLKGAELLRQSQGRRSSSSNVLSVSQDSQEGSRIKGLQVKSSLQGLQGSTEFNYDEATTFNIILSTLRGKKYKDTRREIEYFLKKSKKESFCAILRETLALIDELDAVQADCKGKTKLHVDLLANMAQFDKLFRSEKPEEMEKLKNKCKALSTSVETIQLFQSFINIYAENRRLKKKESASTQKEMKSAEKDRQKRNVESQNEQLKRTIKGLELQLEELSSDKQKLEGSLKKFDRSRPSLPPRRPSTQKDHTPIKTPKKNENHESQLQAQISRLDREVQQLTAKHQASFLSLSAKYSALQLQYESLLSEKKELSSRVKQFQDGNKCFKMITQKQVLKRVLDKEVNDFKRAYPESIFVRVFSLVASEDSTLTNIQNILNLFSDNSWKRRSSFQIKEETPVAGQLNKITQILYDLHKQRDELTKTVEDLKKREIAVTEANEKVRTVGKNNNLKANPINEQLEQLRSQLQQIREANLRLNEQNNRLKTELRSKDKQLQSSKGKQNQDLIRINKELLQETQKENQRLAIQLEKTVIDNQRLAKEAEQQRLALQMIRVQQRNTGGSDGRMDELQGRLVSSQEKLANYKYLFDKTKKERDNLKLQLQEKNEELELLKENEERYETVKRASEVKIVELKHSYQSNQLEIRKIENEVERLLQERQVIISERMVIEERLGVVTQLREKETLELKEQIQVQQGTNRQLQQQIEELNHRYQMDTVGWEQERAHILRGLQRSQEEGIRIKGKYQAEHTEWKDKCDRLAKELAESRKDSAVQREILRQKIADFSRLTETLPAMATPFEDLQKQQLKRQLQLANQQLTVLLRSKQAQKREHRHQIQQLVSASQLDNAVHAEEKRILRQEIQRARNEEYTINQQKIRKLRDDILSLRNENERLIGIIDTNQTNFDHLIAEHREMRSTIAYLQEDNHRITETAELTEKEKLELVHKLETLEQQLIEFQCKISGAMKEQQRVDSHFFEQMQAELRSLNEEKELLSVKNAEQARQLIQMQHELIRLEAELNNRQNQAIKPVNSEYCRYLQQKLKEQQAQQRRLREKEFQLMQRYQSQLQRVRQLQLEKHLQRDNELKATLARADAARQISALKEKLSICELALKQKQEKISQFSKMPYVQLPKQDPQERTRMKNLEEELRFLTAENKRFKTMIEESGRIKHYYEEKNEEYHKLGLQNKRLIQKMGMIEAAAKQIEEKYLQTQSVVMQLENKLQESTFARSWAEQESNGTPSKSMREELEWLRQQLHEREEDIRQLRNRELQNSVTLKRNQELIAELSLKEQRMHRDLCLLEDAKARIRNTEELLRSEKELRRASQAQLTSEIKELRQQSVFLRNQIEDLTSTNFKLQQKLQSASHYEHDFLFEIAKQLDQNYQIQGQQEIQLRILQKISLEIGELIDLNSRLKEQCELINREKQTSIQLAENNINSSLRFMVNDLFDYLSTNQLINPQNLPYLSPNAGGDKLISELGALLKDLFASCACDRQNAARSSQLLKEFKRILDEFCENNNLQNFSRLRSVLMNID